MKVTTQTSHDIDQDEDIVSLLESSLWEATIQRLFKTNLEDAKKVLLNNIGLPTDMRTGYIMYRQKVMDTFKSLYRKHDVQLPEWLED
jgi:hypothetical protein